MFISLAFVTGLIASAKAATTLTGQYQCSTQGNYELCNNQWGIDDGTGSQTATLVSTSGNTITWSTTWTWADNENDVKTYSNVSPTSGLGQQLSAIQSAPTAWNWDYVTESTGIRADVSYDIWLGTTPNGAQASADSSYEIMIWLSGLGGIQPVGSLQTSGVSVAGYTWNIWTGPNSNWEVISFVSQDGNINDFNVDLNDFFKYLTENEGVSSSLYLQDIESGTEPFTGSAELYTTSYSVSVTA
ncbi:glycoside hydrolase family 12 protein [Coniophora puteana RWD-64-598 SS2]|uniref:Glycoside hydrolase family 12 protein n=1 Tax=Coniophora puteana (strain RWD-64-598) TaxID=741705 RepID=A0A5M3MX07_CONPW|nr:glycoside hydrolase family 12 protein [Coniophora puteana RWD-64-598 SS2]EIW83245.1 glycoside hydrolase family 12 protein [Coniophora puteana RWD-64-598 SS2]